MAEPMPTKPERLAEIFRRLAALPAAADLEGAIRLLTDTVNAVEDEWTAIPFDPDSWRTDGRIYPPQADQCRRVDGEAGHLRCRSRKHATTFGPDGSIEVADVDDGRVVFFKPGREGP